MSHLKRIGCGCVFLFVLLILALCLLVYIAFVRPRSAHAQAVTDCVSLNAQAVPLASGIPETAPSAAVRGIFFQRGAIVTVTEPIAVCLSSSPDARGDLRVDDQLEIAVRHPDGSAATWQHDFADPRTGGIAALPPPDISTLFAAGPNQVQVTLRDTRPPVYSASPLWLIVSQPLVPSPMPIPSPTLVSPASTPPLPTPTVVLEPEATPAPTTTSPLPVVTASTQPRPQVTLWPIFPVGALVVLGVIVGLVMHTRPKSVIKPVAAFADSGTLEISDPKTSDVQQIELRAMQPGEVWGIGNRPECKIKVSREEGDQELGVLVMTPEGPVIKSRGAPMWYDDVPVQEHVLFDGDDVYLGQFVLAYRNFFRRRGLDWTDSDRDREGGDDER